MPLSKSPGSYSTPNVSAPLIFRSPAIAGSADTGADAGVPLGIGDRCEQGCYCNCSDMLVVHHLVFEA